MSGNTFTKYTKYTVKELESYVADPGTCVQKLEWKDLVSVLPKYLGNICEGVKACLTQKIGTYDRKVDGVILAFKNTQILSPLSAIRPNSVRCHVKLRTDFYVFRPQIGETIEGTVRYVSTNYLSAVIYRVFNVTIKLKTHRIQNFKRGTVISFIVKEFDMKSDLPFIEGQLISKSDDDIPPVANGVVKQEKTSEDVSQIKPEQNDFGTNEIGECEENLEAKIEDNIPDSVSIQKDTSKKGSKRKRTKLNGHTAKDNVQLDDEMELSISALLSGLDKEMSDAIESDPSASGVEPSKRATQSAEESRPLKKKKKKKQDIDSMEAELLQKFAAQYDEPEVQDLQTDTSGQAKNNHIDTPEAETQSAEKSRPLKKRKKKKQDLDSMEAELLLKIAAQYAEPEAQDLPTDTSGQAKHNHIDTPKTEKVKKTKKKKNQTPKPKEDDFEASIMYSILKCAAEVDEPQRTDLTPSTMTGNVLKKSVSFARGQMLFTEASFNPLDSSDLLEISQLQSPALSSTLKGNEQK